MIQSRDFEEFVLFARGRLGDHESIGDIVSQWEKEREHREAMDDIRQGFEDAEAGRGIPLADALAQVLPANLDGR